MPSNFCIDKRKYFIIYFKNKLVSCHVRMLNNYVNIDKKMKYDNTYYIFKRSHQRNFSEFNVKILYNFVNN